MLLILSQLLYFRLPPTCSPRLTWSTVAYVSPPPTLTVAWTWSRHTFRGQARTRSAAVIQQRQVIHNVPQVLVRPTGGFSQVFAWREIRRRSVVARRFILYYVGQIKMLKCVAWLFFGVTNKPPHFRLTMWMNIIRFYHKQDIVGYYILPVLIREKYKISTL